MKWLAGNGGERANLSYVDLSYANLSRANLSFADLSSANLHETNLRCANLSSADLSHANLNYANLHAANLCYANLRCAGLSYVNLSSANLHATNLCYANLSRANLIYATFIDAHLYGTNLKDAENFQIPIICPSVGTFIGWKKCRENLVVKLQILDESRRSSAAGRKCRCDKALVLAIENLDGSDSHIETAYSIYDEDFEYRVGEIVSVENFCEDRWNEYAEGIHFFITREEAIQYYYSGVR